MTNINLITVLLSCVFIFPIITGAANPLSRSRVYYALVSLIDNLELLAGIIVSIYLTKQIFFENSSGVYKDIYALIPGNIRSFLYGRDILTYLAAVPVILIIVLLVVRIFTNPLYRYVIYPISCRLGTALESMNRYLKGFLGAAWQLPKAIYLVFILGLALNFYSYYFATPSLSKQLNESAVYQLLYKKAIYPALNSNIAKEIPVLVNDSFRRTLDRNSPLENDEELRSLPEQLSKQLRKNIRVIEYFNGVTLDEAIKSNSEIDEAARRIVGNEKNDRKKGQLLYKWISQNLKYDYDKAQRIIADSKGISSGAIVAYNTRKGICFDYSSLYVAMCRAVGLKVRLVTGLGYSGMSWGDHAWNQVYYPDEDRWINVDSTFGSAGNYYDKPDFNVDHRHAEVQGEW